MNANHPSPSPKTHTYGILTNPMLKQFDKESLIAVRLSLNTHPKQDKRLVKRSYFTYGGGTRPIFPKNFAGFQHSMI